jgi:hypothetical protein
LQDFSIKNLGIFVQVAGTNLEKDVRFFGYECEALLSPYLLVKTAGYWANYSNNHRPSCEEGSTAFSLKNISAKEAHSNKVTSETRFGVQRTPKSGHLISARALSGASGKFMPLSAAAQCRASYEADGAGVDPTHRDVYAHSSRPSLIAPPPRSLSRSRSAVL